MKNKSGIYAIIHRDSGKFYIGSSQHVGRRWIDHRKRLRKGNHHSRYLQGAWNKYGETAFAFELLLECAAPQLEPFEQVAIDEFKPAYNMSPTAGAPRGIKHTDEARAKIRAARARQVRTPEYFVALSKGMMGHPVSQHVRDAVGRAHRGTVISEEQRQKISVSQKRRWATRKQQSQEKSI